MLDEVLGLVPVERADAPPVMGELIGQERTQRRPEHLGLGRVPDVHGLLLTPGG